MWFPTLFLPFLTTLLILCFGIGLFLLSGIFNLKRSPLSVWEKILFAFALSQSFLIFGMQIIGHQGISFNIFSLTLLIGLGSALCFGVFSLISRFTSSPESAADKEDSPLSFTRQQTAIFIVLILATFLIKTIYLHNTVIPTATDLGHHLYWAKAISESGELPYYAEQNIVTVDGTVQVTEPEPISDFIIGEHLTLAAIQIYSQSSYFGAFPILFLFLINILSLLALATLSFYLVRGISKKFFAPHIWNGENAFLLTLLFFGPLYSLASPQAKFVSGGVIGNTFGNFFIPIILLCFYRALRKRDSRFLGLGLLFTFTLAYIHHLSTFILLFVLVAVILLHILLHLKSLPTVFRSWFTLLVKPLPLAILALAILFFFFVAMPTYIENSALDTAVGTPTKTTRTGLTLLQIANSSGSVRLALALMGALFFTLLIRSKHYAQSFLLGWTIILLVMTLRPDLLFVDIPSSRIGAYLSFPLGISAVLFLLAFFAHWQKKHLALPKVLALGSFVAIFIFAISEGSLDNGSTLLEASKAEPLVATMHASQYLSNHTSTDDRIIKDHNFIVGDAWIKLFFMRGYSYPFSRAYFNRYETNPDREQCTLAMISTPNTKDGDRCFQRTGVNFVMVESSRDTAQFNSSKKFSKIYTSRYVTIYQKNY